MQTISEILRVAAPFATADNIAKYANYLEILMPKYGIDTALRVRHFLAQVLHESGSLRYVRELASGEAYEGRKDLGNTQPGDGVKYKGRGLIQITGRANYEKLSKAMFGDNTLLHQPELLEQPRWAVESACWFWKSNNLNALADKDDITGVTKRINGGTNGLESRKNFYDKLQMV